MAEKAGRYALWITQDWGAFSKHRDEIHASGISVLWLRWPKYGNLSSVEKSRVIQVVMETVYDLIVTSRSPVYLRVRLEPEDSLHTVLERLTGSILDRPLGWQPVPLT